MAAKGPKKTGSSARAGSASNKEGGPGNPSGSGDKRGPRFVLWPEWNDADINAEKWDIAHKGKEKEKGKSPVAQHYFDDPEGKIELRSVSKVSFWQRPQEFIVDKTPVVVDQDNMNQLNFDMSNEAVYESELMRWVVSQVTTLWQMCKVKTPPEGVEPGVPTEGEYMFSWRPWEHIYALNKVGKGPNIPSYNAHGKYVVKLHWMGCWRKLIIDDTIPFDDDKRCLLPQSCLEHELWPLLLTKALVKVASLDYNGGKSNSEFGDFSVIQCLTGWLPESIPIQYAYKDRIWSLLKTALPEWTLPEEAKEEGEGQDPDKAAQDGKDDNKDKISEKADTKSKDGAKDQKAKEKDKAKDDKKDKGKDKDKEKSKEKGSPGEDTQVPLVPEVVVCASYDGPPRFPASVSLLAEMSDASECLRQNSLSHMFPHPVLLTHTRSCPLEPPPPPVITPAWKLVRPRKKKVTPSDEPIEPQEEKPIQCLWINSPFINYKVSSVPIPTDTHRPKSSLERGGTHTPAAFSVAPIEEEEEGSPQANDLSRDDLEPPGQQEDKASSLDVDTKSKNSSAKEKRNVLSAAKNDSNGDTSDKLSVSSKELKRSVSQKDVDNKSKVGAGSVTDAAPTPDTAAVASADGDAGVQQGEPQDIPDIQLADSKANTKIWLDFENFCKCFRTLHIYHKTHTYACNQKFSDPKMGLAVNKDSKDKKSTPSTAAVNTHIRNINHNTVTNPQHPLYSGPEEKAPHFLFVDSLEPIQIVVNFSAIPEWLETPHQGGKDDLKSQMSKELVPPSENNNVLDSGSVAEADEDPPMNVILKPGSLMAEPYSWKSLVTGQPNLRISTTASKAAALSLPEGRHVLRFHINAPLGYHVHLCSSTQFIFGDEEKVMAELVKESCRFVDNATQVISALGKCIAAFSDSEAFKTSWQEFVTAHCPYYNDKNTSKRHHFELFNDALYAALRKSLIEAQLCTPEMAFAWRAYNFDCITPNIMGLAIGSSRPATGSTSERGSAKGKTVVKKNVPETKVEWTNREPTPEEHVAAVKIQTVFRGFWVRKVQKARTAGTDENLKVKEQLLKAWAVIEPNTESIGLQMFRAIFKADPELMPKYTFYKDEWNKISYSDYSGSFPDQLPNTWFLVFREIFYVTEEMLCVPKLYVPINTCMLRVVNNDNGQEIPRVFQKVAPYVYRKNQRGYTFIAEARTTDQPLASGRWRMRLIGSLSPLPAPEKNEVNSSFNCREIRDYYIPNEKNILLRYIVTVKEDHLASIQLSTSNPDVYVKLQVLDNEVEITNSVGKGHVVLPAFMFHKDVSPEDDDSSATKSSRPSSRASAKGLKRKPSNNALVKKSSNSSQDGRNSRASGSQSPTDPTAIDEEKGSEPAEEVSRPKPHKYVIQAVMLRNSWPLDEEAWNFVNMLRELEKNELKVSAKDDSLSAPKDDKVASSASSKGKEKAGKGGKGGKEKDKSSRPPSQQFDATKAFWTLRVISDANLVDDIEVKKDTERADEIRAMKKAWEEAEPGRAAKAQQSRLKYLNSHLQVDDADATKGEDVQEATEESAEAATASVADGTDAASTITSDAAQLASPKKVLKPVDLTPFFRKSGFEPCILDESIMARKLEIRQAEIAEYRQYRQQVEQQRQQDRINRNKAKIQQLENAEKMQAMLDEARESINKPREEYRQKFLEAERLRLEKLAAEEAAQRAEQEKVASPKGRKSANKSPKKGKK